MYKLLTVTASAIFLVGCHSPEVSDIKINDRVKACSAGFSEDTQTALHASANKLTLEGGASSDFKQETKSIIFSQLPDGDRLKAYEDYIACVENDWNKEPQ